MCFIFNLNPPLVCPHLLNMYIKKVKGVRVLAVIWDISCDIEGDLSVVSATSATSFSNNIKSALNSGNFYSSVTSNIPTVTSVDYVLTVPNTRHPTSQPTSIPTPPPTLMPIKKKKKATDTNSAMMYLLTLLVIPMAIAGYLLYRYKLKKTSGEEGDIENIQNKRKSKKGKKIKDENPNAPPPVYKHHHDMDDDDREWLTNIPPEMLRGFMLQAAVHRAKSQKFEMSKEQVDELRLLSAGTDPSLMQPPPLPPPGPLGSPLGHPVGHKPHHHHHHHHKAPLSEHGSLLAKRIAAAKAERHNQEIAEAALKKQREAQEELKRIQLKERQLLKQQSIMEIAMIENTRSESKESLDGLDIEVIEIHPEDDTLTLKNDHLYDKNSNSNSSSNSMQNKQQTLSAEEVMEEERLLKEKEKDRELKEKETVDKYEKAFKEKSEQNKAAEEKKMKMNQEKAERIQAEKEKMDEEKRLKQEYEEEIALQKKVNQEKAKAEKKAKEDQQKAFPEKAFGYSFTEASSSTPISSKKKRASSFSEKKSTKETSDVTTVSPPTLARRRSSSFNEKTGQKLTPAQKALAKAKKEQAALQLQATQEAAAAQARALKRAQSDKEEELKAKHEAEEL